MHRFGVDDQRYLDWISYVFDRPSAPDGSFFDYDDVEVFVASPAEIVDLVGTTMLRSGKELREFTDSQVVQCIQYIFYPLFSQNCFCFSNNQVRIDNKIAAIHAIKHLYTDFFEVRCDPCLLHRNEWCGNNLNYVAYMLWDFTPIFRNNRDLCEINTAVMEVLSLALECQNDACIEGGLHGLGENRIYVPQLTDPIINRFLEATRDIEATASQKHEKPDRRPVRRALREYALQALAGQVQ